MPKHATQPTKIDQQLAGTRITLGGRTVLPLARLTGERGENNGPSGGGAGARVRLTPLEVTVCEPDGSERRIAMTDPTGRALRTLIATAAFVAMISAFLIALARLSERRG